MNLQGQGHEEPRDMCLCLDLMGHFGECIYYFSFQNIEDKLNTTLIEKHEAILPGGDKLNLYWWGEGGQLAWLFKC